MWEALTAIGTIASAVVITVTVIMAARQVKLTTDQLDQSRRATQFEAARSVLFEMADPKFVSAYRFVIHDLPARLHDDAFYRGVGQIGLADDTVHQEIYLLRSLDRVGTYVKHGLVDGEIIYGSYWARIISCWELLSGVVEIHRHIAGKHFWENAQYLHDDCKLWVTRSTFDYDALGALRRMNEFTSSATAPPAADTKA